ncbi:hypothetical protein HAX54_016631 [Datura stramonium]|uniref:Secreted protein n=1 Tax=Datura stramonium TaxID=4076 RepID=A0ABS8UJ96_DATST|nr:hypothetical protein [Datura stramonium]
MELGSQSLMRCIALKVGPIAPAIAALLLLHRVASSARMKAPRAWNDQRAITIVHHRAHCLPRMHVAPLDAVPLLYANPLDSVPLMCVAPGHATLVPAPRASYCRVASAVLHTSWRWAGWRLMRCIALKVGHVAPAIAALLLPRRVASSARMKAPCTWQYAQVAVMPRVYVPS